MQELLADLAKHPMFSGGIALMVAGALVGWLRRLQGRAIPFLGQRLTYTVSATETHLVWRFDEWALRYRGNALPRTLLASLFDKPYLSSTATENLRLNPGPGTYFFRYHGRLVIYQKIRKELSQNGEPAGHRDSVLIRFLGANEALIRRFQKEIDEIMNAKLPGVTYYSDNGCEWRFSGWLPRRPPDSLSLADGVLEEVVAEINAFRESHGWYADRGIPHRRGYLLHGPPGTGKTTLPHVIASQLGLSIYSVNVGGRGLTDSSLRGLMNLLPWGALVVFEDVDAVFDGRKQENEHSSLTFSGLLNAIDGIGGSNGRVLFMTTNHPERFDPALIRPGRVDRQIELGYATATQAERMFRWFFKDHPLGDQWVGRLAAEFGLRLLDKTAPAAIQEHLLRHRDDPVEAIRTFGGPPPLAHSRFSAQNNGHHRVLA